MRHIKIYIYHSYPISAYLKGSQDILLKKTVTGTCNALFKLREVVM